MGALLLGLLQIGGAAAAERPIGWTEGPPPPTTTVEAWPMGTATSFHATITTPGPLQLATDGAVWFPTSARTGVSGVLRAPVGGEPAVLPGLAGVRDLTPAPDGGVWGLDGSGSLVHVDPDGTEAPVDTDPSAGLTGLVTDHEDGAWFLCDDGDGCVGHVAADGTVETLASTHELDRLVGGTDGTAWGLVPLAAHPTAEFALVRFDPDASQADTYPLEGLGADVWNLTPSTDGAWFTTGDCSSCPMSLHRLDLDELGTATVTAVDDPDLANPWHLVVGDDDALWATTAEARTSATWGIARVTAQGAVQHVDGLAGPLGSPQVGPDGELWLMTDVRDDDGVGDVVRLGPDMVLDTVLPDAPDLTTLPYVNDFLVAEDGLWWAVASQPSQVVRVSLAGEVEAFHDMASPQGLAVSSDGVVWTEPAWTGTLAALRPDGGLELAAHGAPYLSDLTIGHDDRPWFTDETGDRVGRVAADGSVEWFEDPGLVAPRTIAPGPDGRMWFANDGAAAFGHVGEDGDVGFFDDPGVAEVDDLAMGPDGHLWFTAPQFGGGGQVGHVSPAGDVTLIPHPLLDRSPREHRGALVAGPDGNMWHLWRSHISRITPAGTITTFAMPPLPGEPGQGVDLEVGIDGNLWATFGLQGEGSTSYIARVTPNGTITAHPNSPFPVGSVPWSLASDPAGRLWTIPLHDDAVVRIELRCEPPFPDVPTANPFCGDIRWLAGSGIAAGYDDGTFRPGAEVSRQAMAAFLHRRAGAPAPAPGPAVFADVPPGHRFFDAIQWMGQQGISTGTPQPGDRPLFKPAAPTERQAMAAFLHRAEGTPPVAPGPALFADVPSGHRFFDAIQWMGQEGISTGTPQPGGLPLYRTVEPVSRQAMAAFLHRLAPGAAVR